MSDPKIIFGDEPTGALNSKSAQEIMNILAEINADGTAIMLVTHDAKVAAQTERIMFMRDGKIVSEMRLTKFDGTDIDGRMQEVAARMREIGI
jgi:putative ABC transport system ATP-binding protein